MPATRTESLSPEAGGAFTGTVVVPDAGRGPGIVLFQEVFGVGEFILAKAEALAELGYVVVCPDVFWRVQPGIALAHDEAALAEAFAHAEAYGAIEDETRMADLGAAVSALRALPEVTGPVATMGYCLGGTLAYRAASRFDVDACVSYYGSGVAAALAAGERPSCPTLLHFGGDDPYLPAEDVAAIRRDLADDRDDVEVHVQPGAGHAFENFASAQFSDPEAAAASWPLTVAFLERHLLA